MYSLSLLNSPFLSFLETDLGSFSIFFFDSWHSVISSVERGRRDISVYSGCLCFFPKELRVVLLPSSGVLLQLSVPIVEMASLTSS